MSATRSKQRQLVMLLSWIAAAPLHAQSEVNAFVRDWKDSKVVLVQPLYTIQYPTVDRLSPGRVGTKSAAVTIVTPDKGTYYYAQPSGVRIADTDPERLVARVTAATANQKLQSFTGSNKRNVTAPPAVLLTYEPGTMMTVVGVHITGRWVRLDLNDEFNSGGASTTALLLEWPGAFTRTFDERGEIEATVAKFLRRQAMVSGADRHQAPRNTDGKVGPAPPMDGTLPASDSALLRYVTTDGTWHWIEDKNEEFFHESSGRASSYYEWDSMYLQPRAVSVYSKNHMGGWCNDCAIRITQGSYSILRSELTILSGTVELIRLDRAAGTTTPRGLATLTGALKRQGTVLDAQKGRLVIRWGDGTLARFRRLQLPR